jgi:hypothetical protein
MSRIRADKFVNNAANGAPQLTFGAEVVAGVGLTGAGGINITGIATAASFSGNLTGNVTGTTGTFTGDVDIADKIVHTGDTNTAIRFPAADTFAVETAGSERLRVDSSGKTGINVNNPGSYNSAGNELVLGNTGNNGGMTIVSGTGNNGHIFFADGTGTPNQGIIKYEHANDAMAFNTNTGERVRITSGGEVQIANGNLKFTTAGKGIDFSATSDGGGMTSELLDDYEEGTWTPTVTASGGTITSATASGEYTKIGNIVRFQLSITISNVGSGTGTLISTLPFNPANANWAASGAEDVTAGYTCIVFGNGTNVFIRKYDYSTAIVNGHRLKIAGTFQV